MKNSDTGTTPFELDNGETDRSHSITALADALNTVIEATNELDCAIGKASENQLPELQAQYDDLVGQIEQLEYAVAEIPAQTLAEAVIQLRILAGLLHCDANRDRGRRSNLSDLKDMLIHSVANALEREARIDRSEFAGLYYLGPPRD